MNRILQAAANERSAVAKLEESPPGLIEVRFLRATTSSDWQLCVDEEQLDRILDRLSPGAELHISSVWDLKSAKGEICLRT